MYPLAWLIVLGMILFALLIAAAIAVVVALLVGDEKDTSAPIAPPGGHTNPSASASLADGSSPLGPA